MKPGRLIIKWITPWVWGRWPARRALALGKFSRTERDSGWHLLRCAERVEDPRLMAMLFEQAQEEQFHGDLFEVVARKAGWSAGPHESLGRDHLLPRSADSEALARFCAYAYVGEASINRDFPAYAAASRKDKSGAVFRRVVEDEERHEAGTSELLVNLCAGDRRRVRRLIAGAHFARFGRRLSALGQSVGAAWFTLFAGALYFSLGWVLRGEMRRRLKS